MNTIKYFLICIVCFFVVFVAYPANAQWVPPSSPPPANNIPVFINVENISQKKTGPSAGLIFKIDPDWDPRLTSAFSLFTDKTIYVKNRLTSAVEGLYNNYGFSTSAPISVNGIFSKSEIYTNGELSVNSLEVKNLSIPTTNGISQEQYVCVENQTKKLIPCVTGSSDIRKISANITVSPETVAIGVPTSVNVSWSSANATTCYAAEGPGFRTQNMTSSSTTSSKFTLKQVNDAMVFTIACLDSVGNIAYDSTQVNAVGATTSPNVELTLDGNYNVIQVPSNKYLDQFLLKAEFSGPKPDWCKTWTTWSGNNINNGPQGPDAVWPGTSSSKSPINVDDLIDYGYRYRVDAFPVGWEGVEGDPLVHHSGGRTYWIECGNAQGSSISQVTINLY